MSTLLKVCALPWRCARQAALERQDLSHIYLAHHELESDIIVIPIIIMIIMMNIHTNAKFDVIIIVIVDGAYRVVGGEEGGRGWEVCLDDLSASGHKSISPGGEVVSGLVAVFICEADGHVAGFNDLQCPSVRLCCLRHAMAGLSLQPYINSIA